MIEGGYYIKARCIQNSNISFAPPHIREIWDWLIKEVNHKDNKICLRGQCIRTYKDIINGLSWMVGWRKMGYTKSQCENAMKYLKKHTMIATKKTTRGMVITVLNYDKYQDIKNYKDTMSATIEATGKPQSSHTINKELKEEKNKEETIKEKTYTKDNLTIKEMAVKFSEVFTKTTNRSGSFPSTCYENLDFWLGEYDPNEIVKAIKNIPYDDFWKDKMTLTILFRKKSPHGEPVDYISNLLSVKKTYE